MPRDPTTPKMRDVAERSGVSESTVSHVLNGTKAISPATRERVLRAVGELNYHRDSHARRLASRRSDVLGLIISDIENPFFPGLIKAFDHAARAGGYDVLLCATDYDAARAAAALGKMAENRVGGVAVMTSHVAPAMAAALAGQRIPCVFLDPGVPPAPFRGTLRLDFAPGASAAVRYLHNLGHRDFAVVAGPQSRASHRAYRAAVERALATLGLRARAAPDALDADGGERAARALLTGGACPTAVLCGNDVVAMGVCRALARSGVRVPADVSVVGADDIPFAALTQPPLTTVRMPRDRLGQLAVESLRQMIAAPGRRGADVVVATELVIRESTGPAPAGGTKRRATKR